MKILVNVNIADKFKKFLIEHGFKIISEEWYGDSILITYTVK